MYYASVSLLAIVVHLIVNGAILSRKRSESPEHVIRYKLFLIAVLLYYITDALWGILYQFDLRTLCFLDTITYFVAMALSIYLWMRYVVSYLNRRNFFTTLLMLSGWVVILFEIICLMLNFKYPIMFSFNGNGEYMTGYARHITLYIQVLMFGLVAAYALWTAIKLEKKLRIRHIAIGVAGIMMIIFIVFQTNYPLLPFYAVGCLITTCIVDRFIAEDEKMEAARQIGAAIQEKEELEERVALQEELLEQVKMRHEANGMITAMAQDYRSVYYVDLDRDLATCYRANVNLHIDIKEGDTFSFSQMMRQYAGDCVSDVDRSTFLKFIDPDNIRKALKREAMIAYRYLSVRGGREMYEMIRIAAVDQKNVGDGQESQYVGVGFSDVDTKTREEMSTKSALSDALDQAAEANAVKASFLNSVSHELRTPMNAIIGYATIARKDPNLSDKTREYFEKIEASSNQLLGIINDIIDVGRIERGRMTIREEEFSLNSTIEQINMLIREQCRQKGLEYKCIVLSKSLNKAYIGDQARLEQVLINILSNAVKFTDAPGAISFSVEETARFNANATLKFVIRDTGIGMNPEFMPRIFEAFAQEEESPSNEYGRTGLGMAITKNLVDLMNGTIDIQSEKNKGTVVTISVTLKIPDSTNVSHDESNADDAIQALQREIDENPNEILRDKRILLAEDMLINAEIMKELLTMHGMQVDVVENGEICLERFKRCEPDTYDAILMDIRMPKLDGLEATEQIRALKREDAKTVPIIAMTANAFEEDVQKSLQVGMDAHLTKPVDEKHLLEILTMLISKHN